MNYVVMILIFCCGISIGLNVSFFINRKTVKEGAKKRTVEEIELEKRKARFEAEQKAFEQVMNYNRDVAYGIAELE